MSIHYKDRMRFRDGTFRLSRLYLVNWPIRTIKRRRERPGRTCIQILIPENVYLILYVALTCPE
jgi:hypothetical protein